MDTEVAYLAGVFDGEGWITRANGQGIRVGVQMTDKDILDRFVAAFGGNLYGPQNRPNRKPIYQWWVQAREDVWRFLDAVAPFLGERRKARIKELADLRVSKGTIQREKVLLMRADLGWSPKRIAERLGLHPSYVSRLLSGARGVS